MVLQLEALPVGVLERASGADLERLHWLRNVEFANDGKTVTDQQQAFDFFYDTTAPLTTINQRMADSLGLSTMDASFSCLGGENNGYVLSSVTMFGAEGFYRIENASVCLQPDAVTYGDGLIGSNFFDQVQILLDGPAETLGIIDGRVANPVLTSPAHVRAPVSPIDDERLDRERLNSGLAAYYPLDGNAWDAGANGNHGTVIGPTPAADRQCTPFGAFRYDGRQDMISVDHSPSFEFTQALSIAAWVHPDVQQATGHHLEGSICAWAGRFSVSPDAWRCG